MITYNMATYVPNCTGNGLCASVGGCNAQLEGPPPVDTFAPTSLDTDQWVDVMIEYGAKYGVLVIQHCSGFSMFETNEFVLNATGFNYTYGVEFASWGGGKRDVMREFVDSCKRKGVQPAVYYSLNHNWYLNAASSVVQPGPLKPGQVSVTQKQYEAIALAQYTALLTRYGDLAEVWFDGGMDHLPGFSDLIRKAQPHAGYFGGTVAGGANVRWVGTESGTPAYPVWSTAATYAAAGAGTPGGAIFNPAEVDTTLYAIDHWFWSPSPGFKIRSLAELVDVYHHSVGSNGGLLMNLTPDMSGKVPDEHRARLKAAGDFVEKCYGTAVASTSGQGSQLKLEPLAASVDRIMLEEDQAQGERITAYTLLNAATGATLGNGTAVGHKRIQLLAAPVAAGRDHRAARRRLARHARRRPIRRLRPRALRGVVVRTTLAITKRGRTHVFMAPLPHWAPTHDTRDTRAREVPSVRCSADATRQVHALGIHSAEHSLHSFLCSFQCCCWCSGQQ